MKKKINSRLIFIALLATITTTLCITFFYYSLFVEQVKKDLKVAARILSEEGVSNLADNDEIIGNQEIRITWIDNDGSVLFDNDVHANEMKNHLNRPEVKEAFETGSGESVRNSDTMHRTTFYYATLMKDGTVLRVSMKARSLSSVFLSAIPVVIMILALISILCIFISHMLTKQLLQPIEKMAENMDDHHSCDGYEELSPFMERIREQHEDILSYAKSRQDFTANVSHELKTPLTAISGYAELIENHMVDEGKEVHFAAEIRKNANRLVCLINDIINLSELDQKDRKIELDSIDLFQVTEERLELLRSNAREKNISIILEGDRCILHANKGMMIELIDNLVQNAIRYNVINGKIRVFVMKEDNHVILKVSDTGIGIPKEDQEHVFERFYRVDKSRSRETGGTGLGLAIVKHIVELHNGEIALTSEVDKGTIITVKL